jgi:hypothetical protein
MGHAEQAQLVDSRSFDSDQCIRRLRITVYQGVAPKVSMGPYWPTHKRRALSKPVRWTGWQTMPESWDWITDGCTRQQAITRLEAA